MATNAFQPGHVHEQLCSVFLLGSKKHAHMGHTFENCQGSTGPPHDDGVVGEVQVPTEVVQARQGRHPSVVLEDTPALLLSLLGDHSIPAFTEFLGISLNSSLKTTWPLYDHSPFGSSEGVLFNGNL